MYKAFRVPQRLFCAIAPIAVFSALIVDTAIAGGDKHRPSQRAQITIEVNDACEVVVQSTRNIRRIAYNDGESIQYRYNSHGGAEPIGNSFVLDTYANLFGVDGDFARVKVGNRHYPRRARGQRIDVDVPQTPACEATCPDEARIGDNTWLRLDTTFDADLIASDEAEKCEAVQETQALYAFEVIIRPSSDSTSYESVVQVVGVSPTRYQFATIAEARACALEVGCTQFGN